MHRCAALRGEEEAVRYIVNSREMKQYDDNTTEHFGVPQEVLMERAATAFVQEIRKREIDTAKTLVVCGSGNNGGDGYAIARLLMLAGDAVDVVAALPKAKATEGNLLQQKIYKAYGGQIHTKIPEHIEYTAVVDAIFGVGLSRGIEGEPAALLTQMNEMSGTKLAVDIPSGISSDNGSVLGTAFKADLTVTFAYEKLGSLLWPGNTFAGEVALSDVGINDRSFLERGPAVAALEKSDLSCLAVRESHSNKGTFGKLLVIAGSKGMAGAAYLCAKAAYISGCGLVRIFTPEENREIVQTMLPEAVLTTYSAKKPDAALFAETVGWADAIVCGPGLGTTETSEWVVRHVLKCASVPVLFDADALNVIARDVSILLRPHTELVVTPHLGEMSRLSGDPVAYIQNHLIEVAKEFARQYNVICVLKDEHTVTGVPYSQTWLNLSGCAGLATAGSGDVLSGVIGGLMAQGMAVEAASTVGVYLHGLAGEAAAKENGLRSMTASDIHAGLRSVYRTLEQQIE